MKSKDIKGLLPYIFIIIIVILIKSYIITPVIVKGNSMTPTLNENEILLLNKFSKEYKRFDIVVLDKSVEGDNLIKRIIGLPNETLEYIDEKLYINGKEIEDNYNFGLTTEIDKVTLGKDEYYVMGDNRDISLDSRILGKINKNQIEGKINFTLFPFNKFGEIK